MPDNALSEVYGIQPQLQELLAAGALEADLPPAWLEDLAVAGDPEEVAAKIRALLDAGSDSVCLWLFPLDRGEELLRLTAHEVLPRI
jgi:alkanesulfonate monooxygenase SsuD/methylene tetrahydromethanopterin reductase-like flavin-dependent oxidoreductase (luciferase family)